MIIGTFILPIFYYLIIIGFFQGGLYTFHERGSKSAFNPMAAIGGSVNLKEMLKLKI